MLTETSYLILLSQLEVTQETHHQIWILFIVTILMAFSTFILNIFWITFFSFSSTSAIVYNIYIHFNMLSIQFCCSVMSDSLRTHESRMPGLPVHHQLPEFTQTHVHWVGDAIQPSHPLSSPSSPAPNLSQHQGLFQWVNSSHEVAKVLEFQLQHQSFQWTPRTNLL